MNFKKLIIPSVIVTSAIPVAFVVSCSSSGDSEDHKQLSQTIELKEFLSSNTNALTPLTSNQPTMKTFAEYSNWKNLDDFISSNFLGKYFTIDSSFKDKLSENNNNIFNKIVQFVIQPKVNSKDLTVIFYLDKISTDLNVVSFDVKNALSSSFAYSNQIEVPSNPTILFYGDKNQFNEAWKKVSNSNVDKVNLVTLKDMLKRAFAFDDSILDVICNNWKNNYFKIYKNSNYQIELYITQEGLDNGFIFHKNTTNSYQYETEIFSNSLVK